MPTPISYLSGNTLSYQSGMVKKGTIGLNLTSSLTGNYRWWNGVDATSSQYLIYSDTYSTGASSESNVTPAAWSTPDLTDTSLLNLINTLPDRVGQTAFTSLSNALIWLNQSGKYFLVKNGYENLVTSGLTLNLDAGWTNSYSGTTSWRDISGNGKIGTLTNGPAFNSGNTGSIYFDGTDDFCVVPSSSLNGLSSGSISVWVKFLNLNFQYVLSLPNSSGNNGFDILIENGKLDSYLQATNSAGSTGSQFVPKLGIWYNIVTTYDGTTHKLFVNGVFISSVGRSGTIQNGIGQTFLGRFSSGFGAYSNNYTSNAQLYNRALSQTEILQNYQLYKNRFGYDVVENGLVLNLNAQNYVSYRETGTSWYDLTSNNNTGTLTNGPTFDSTTRSIVLDGIDDFISGSTLTNLLNGSTTLTLIIWVYPTNLNNTSGSPYKTLVDTPSRNLSLWIGANGQGQYYGIGGASSSYNVNFNWENNKWQMVSIIVTATNGQIIKNNYVVSETTLRGNNYTERVTFGNNPSSGGGNLEGRYGNILLYNRALSVAEVLQNYYQGNIVTNGLIMNLDAGNLISYGGTGTSWKDLTNTTTGATLVNGPTYNTSNGGSIVFDGTDDYVTTTNFYLSTLPASVLVWFKAGTQTSNSSSILRPIMQQGLFDGNFPANTQGIEINMMRSGSDVVGKLRFAWGGDNDSNYIYLTDNRYDDNQWHFACIINNGGTFDVYIDGVYLTTKTTHTSVSTSTPVNFGGDTAVGARKLVGNISNAQIYNRALTQSEIIQNFNAHKSRYGL
jgi:hypothetical protein